jgi:hypothetical protein
LKFPEDREFLAQQAEQEGEAASKPTSPDPNMIPVGEVAGIVEQEVIVREHRQRWAQAMQDPQFAEYAANASAADVGLDHQILTSIAAQANSPVVVAFLANRPDIAEELAAMPVARGVAEVAKLSAWLQIQLQQQTVPQTAPRRVSAAPPPIRPLGGSPTKTNAVDLNTCDYQTYRRVRDVQSKCRYNR